MKLVDNVNYRCELFLGQFFVCSEIKEVRKRLNANTKLRSLFYLRNSSLEKQNKGKGRWKSQRAQGMEDWCRSLDQKPSVYS